MLAAASDAWHMHAQQGAPSWVMTSIFANHVPNLLMIAGALAALLHHRFKMHGTPLRIAVWLLALCSFAMTAVGVGALITRHIGAALIDISPEPNTVRAIAAEQVFIAVAVLIAADLTARAMQRAESTDRRTSVGGLN